MNKKNHIKTAAVDDWSVVEPGGVVTSCTSSNELGLAIQPLPGVAL